MARKRLTELACERARPTAGGRVELFDGPGGVPGLSLRVGTSGAKSWALLYRIGRKQHRSTLGRYPDLSLTKARTRARELLTLAQQGIAPDTDPATARRQQKLETVGDVAGAYLEHVRRQGQRREADVARMIKGSILPAIGNRPVAGITRRDIKDLVAAIADRAPVMANRVQSLLGRIFAWAVEEGELAASPAAGLKPPAREESRERLLTDDELAAVWRASEALGWPFREITRLLILTGARRSEVAGLTWDEIDLEKALWTKPKARTKNAKVQVLPLSEPALAIINALPRIDGSAYVFPARTGSSRPVSGFSNSKLALDRLSGVRDWTYHDFRRAIASGLQKMGVALQVTECILGHVAGSRAGVVGIYSRYDYLPEQKAALEKWGRHVLALGEGARAPTW